MNCLNTFHEICKFLSPADVLSLSRTCPAWASNDLGRQRVHVWKPQALALIESIDDLPNTLVAQLSKTPSNYKTVIALILDRGCQKCFKPRIRKITWNFFQRLCQPCIEAETIAEHYLKTTYGCSQSMLQKLPSITVSLWNRYHGSI